MTQIVASINSRLETSLIPLAMLTSSPSVVTINEGIKGRIKFLGGIIKVFPSILVKFSPGKGTICR
jgi:hypothetical protein